MWTVHAQNYGELDRRFTFSSITQVHLLKKIVDHISYLFFINQIYLLMRRRILHLLGSKCPVYYYVAKQIRRS